MQIEDVQYFDDDAMNIQVDEGDAYACAHEGGHHEWSDEDAFGHGGSLDEPQEGAKGLINEGRQAGRPQEGELADQGRRTQCALEAPCSTARKRPSPMDDESEQDDRRTSK